MRHPSIDDSFFRELLSAEAHKLLRGKADESLRDLCDGSAERRFMETCKGLPPESRFHIAGKGSFAQGLEEDR